MSVIYEYEIRISKWENDDRWHWSIIRHSENEGLDDTVACFGQEQSFQQIENSADAALARLKEKDDLTVYSQLSR